jgi:UDP-N-acetylmuramyl pentapeptide phosphotransferase/UDP-N-acetylglucosamine-1-phosphate transferase
VVHTRYDRAHRYLLAVPILPFVVATVTALVLAPALRASLAENGFVRENYRGEQLPFPFGVAVVAAAAVALAPLALIYAAGDDTLTADTPPLVLTFVLGVAALGLADDALSGASRGWRGHGAAVMRGSFSTGALKAAGTLGLALWVTSDESTFGRQLLATGVLVLATNLFNLLDLRPGRSVKAFVLLGAALAIGEGEIHTFERLGLFIGPLLVAGVFDVRERAMLGDTGSNLTGALAGLWLVLVLGTTGQIVALAVLAAITAYGEFRSISALVDRTPGLRHLDSLGRIHRA